MKGIRLSLLIVICMAVFLSISAFAAARDSPDDAQRILSQLGSSPEIIPGVEVTYPLPNVKFKKDSGDDLDLYLFRDSSPIDVYIDIDGYKKHPAKPAKLTMRVYDVDSVGFPSSCGPEVDRVIVNGHEYGVLSGASDQFSIFTADIQPADIVEGINHIEILIDTTASDCWAVLVDWVELVMPFNLQVMQVDALDDIDMLDNAGNAIADPIWKKQFDTDCNVIDTTPPTNKPYADWFKSGKTKIKVTLDACPAKPTWKPIVVSTLLLKGPFTLTGKADSFIDWEKELEVTMDQAVFNDFLKTQYAIFDPDIKRIKNQEDKHKVYIVYEKPKTDVSPPKEIWLDKATTWGRGAKTDDELAVKIKDGIYSQSGWIYEDKAPGWKTLAESTAGTEANCWSYANVWWGLSRVGGIDAKEGGVGQTKGANGMGFLTKAATALDGKTGNAHPTGNTTYDKWSFSMHQTGLYNGKYYDPTMGNVYTSLTDFVHCNVNGFIPGGKKCDNGQKIKGDGFKHPGNWQSMRYENSTALNGIGARFTGVYLESTADVNGDGRFDSLSVTAEVNISVPENYQVYGFLNSSAGHISSRRTRTSQEGLNAGNASVVGLSNVKLDFSGEDIKSSSINGPYKFELSIINSTGYLTDNVTFTSSPYLTSQFSEVTADILLSSDSGIDTNANGLFNFLSALVTVQSFAQGNYTVTGSLETSSGLTLGSVSNSSVFTGNKTLALNFPSGTIWLSQQNGPYVLRVSLLQDGSSIGYQSFSTSAYSFTAFDAPLAFFNNIYSQQTLDTDGDGQFNFLVFNIGVNASIPQVTLSAGIFDTNGTIISPLINSTNVTTGINTLKLFVKGQDIYRQGVNGPYQLKSLSLSDNESTLLDFRSNPFNTTALSYLQFQKPLVAYTGLFSSAGVDNDTNGYFDELRLTATVLANQSGTYTFDGTLRNSSGNIITIAQKILSISAGLQNITIAFQGPDIVLSGANGPYGIEAKIFNINMTELIDHKPDAHNTSAYNFTQFDKPPIYMTGKNSDSGIDTNSNTLFDALRVNLEVVVQTADTYYANARLKDSSGNEIDVASTSIFIPANTPTNVTLDFLGANVNGNGVNGPYLVKDLTIYDSSDSFEALNIYTTGPYNLTQFEAASIIKGFVKSVNGSIISDSTVFDSFAQDFDTTNENGSFTLTLSSAGFVTLTALSPVGTDYLAGTASTTAIAGSTVFVNITLTQTGRLTGIVKDDSGNTVSGADVSASGPSFISNATGASGEYLLAGLANGNYSVTATPPSGTNLISMTTTATVFPSQTTSLNFTLPVGGSLSGIVTNPSGSPVAFASVTLTGPVFGFTFTDTFGNYSFIGLTNGTYTLTIDPPFGANLLSVIATPTIVQGAPTTTNIIMPFGGILLGTVTDNTGTPVSDASVSLSGPLSLFTTTDSFGNYSFIALVNGTYTVTVDPPFGSTLPSFTGSVNIVTGITTTLNIILTKSTLRTYTISPTGPISVAQNSFFNFSGGVQCVGEDSCGNVTAILDPHPETGYMLATIPSGFINISSTGTNSGIVGDDVSTDIPIGFTFSFFGINYTTISVGSNGYMTFPPESGTIYSNSNIPDISSPNNIIAPFWDDLIVFSPAAVYSQVQGVAPARKLIVQWNNVNPYGGSPSTGTFETILYETSNTIEFHYADLDFGTASTNNGASATVGIENPSGTAGVLYSFDTPSLTTTQALRFALATSKGVVPMNSGSPFYTISQNPVPPANLACLSNMGNNSQCNVSWTVKATGSPGQSFDFFIIFNSSLGTIEHNITSIINVTITNLSANLPPTLSSIGNQVINENSTLIIQLNATDPEGNPLTFSTNAFSVLFTQPSFNATTGLFSYTPGFYDQGPYQITFTVSDGQLSDSETITLTTKDNDPSTLTITGIPTVNGSGFVTFNLQDPINPNTTYIFAMSLSPTPGLALLDGRVVPVTFDPVFSFTTDPAIAPLIGLSGITGLTSLQGNAQTTWAIPYVPAAAGLTLYPVMGTYNPALTGFGGVQAITSISNSSLTLLP